MLARCRKRPNGHRLHPSSVPCWTQDKTTPPAPRQPETSESPAVGWVTPTARTQPVVVRVRYHCRPPVQADAAAVLRPSGWPAAELQPAAESARRSRTRALRDGVSLTGGVAWRRVVDERREPRLLPWPGTVGEHRPRGSRALSPESTATAHQPCPATQLRHLHRPQAKTTAMPG